MGDLGEGDSYKGHTTNIPTARDPGGTGNWQVSNKAMKLSVHASMP